MPVGSLGSSHFPSAHYGNRLTVFALRDPENLVDFARVSILTLLVCHIYHTTPYMVPWTCNLHLGGFADDDAGYIRACLVTGSQNLGSCRKSGHHIENHDGFHFGSSASEKVHEMNALEVNFLGSTVTVPIATMPSLHTSLLQGCMTAPGHAWLLRAAAGDAWLRRAPLGCGALRRGTRDPRLQPHPPPPPPPAPHLHDKKDAMPG